VKFRVTYWPGTAAGNRNCPCCACCTRVPNKQELLDRIQKVVFLDYNSYKDALNGTAARYIQTSDGVLIEYVKNCTTCGKEYFTTAEDSRLCHECGEKHETELKLAAGPFHFR
jgi:hypothetical protein